MTKNYHFSSDTFCLIAPSILAADFGNIQKEIETLNKSKADFIHLDIMDGVFVPNISFGFPVIEAIQKYSQKSLDFHLMIQNPQNYIQKCKDMGAEIITVHYEACTHLCRTIEEIKKLPCKVGVALNPHTPVSVLKDIIHTIDVVLIMSVNPGFGGQKFLPHCLKKVQQAKEIIINADCFTYIQVDGGIDIPHAKKLLYAGANILVIGSAIFQATNPLDTIDMFKKLKNEYI
ncbi:MAG: ribulose-phosphate 3-epimerase [Chitinophagaceae bacterium]|nr:ribulose-phosphate 3-epimerase [Chitinophagaceae bacterium]